MTSEKLGVEGIKLSAFPTHCTTGQGYGTSAVGPPSFQVVLPSLLPIC